MLLTVIVLFVVLFIVLPLLGMAAWALISAAVVGLIIGALARLVVPGTRGMGLLPTILLGLVGSIVGGFIADHLLHTAGLVTVLIEIGTAAVATAIFARRRQELGRRPF